MASLNSVHQKDFWPSAQKYQICKNKRVANWAYGRLLNSSKSSSSRLVHLLLLLRGGSCSSRLFSFLFGITSDLSCASGSMCSLNPGQDEMQVQIQLSYWPFGFLFVILALSDDVICVVASCIVVSVKQHKMWHVVEGVCNGFNVWIKRVRWYKKQRNHVTNLNHQDRSISA